MELMPPTEVAIVELNKKNLKVAILFLLSLPYGFFVRFILDYLKELFPENAGPIELFGGGLAVMIALKYFLIPFLKFFGVKTSR